MGDIRGMEGIVRILLTRTHQQAGIKSFTGEKRLVPGYLPG